IRHPISPGPCCGQEFERSPLHPLSLHPPCETIHRASNDRPFPSPRNSLLRSTARELPALPALHRPTPLHLLRPSRVIPQRAREFPASREFYISRHLNDSSART